jgi:hypothetical protein
MSAMRDPGAVRWLVLSIVLSVALTVALNVALRVFPRVNARIARGVERLPLESRDDHGTRVIVPWRAMLVASVVLTILANVILRWRD